MSRADILNMPHIAAKLEKLQSVHTDHEARMDRWNREAMAQQKETKHETGKPHNKRGRKRQDKKAAPRRKAAKASRGDGVQHEAGGETDQGRGIQEEKVIDKALITEAPGYAERLEALQKDSDA